MRQRKRYIHSLRPVTETARIKHSAALPRRARETAGALQQLAKIFEPLFADENFVTLLRAESLTMVPAVLYPLVEKGRDGHDLE